MTCITRSIVKNRDLNFFFSMKGAQTTPSKEQKRRSLAEQAYAITNPMHRMYVLRNLATASVIFIARSILVNAIEKISIR